MAAQQEQDRRGGGDRSTDGEDQRENGAEQFSSKDGGREGKGREREREKERRRGSVDFSISQVEILRRQGISCNGTNSGDGSGEPGENEDRSPPPAATPMDLIRNPNIRKKFFILAFDWVANAVVYNGLSYNATNLGVSDYLAFFIGKNLVASTNGLRTTAPLVNMFSHSIGLQSICKDTDLYAKFRYVCECVCFFQTRQSRPLFPLLYIVYVSLSYFRRTRGNTVVRDHVVRDGSIREEMGIVPDHAFRRPRLRLLHVRSRR